MQPTPETRASLLLRIRDSEDAAAWKLFVEIYARLIYSYLRKRGLQDADAADVAQEVLHRVSRAIRRFEYDPQRGSFRNWLFTIVHNQWRTHLHRKKEQGAGDEATQDYLLNLPAEEDSTEWETDYRRAIFRWAARRVRADVSADTWQAFWLTSMEGKSGQEVGTQLKMSVGSVYVARSRVIARLRAVVQEFDEFDRPPTEVSDG